MRPDGCFLFVAWGISGPLRNKGRNILFRVGAASFFCLLLTAPGQKGMLVLFVQTPTQKLSNVWRVQLLLRVEFQAR